MNHLGRAGTGRAIAVAAGSVAAITLAARLVGFGRWFAFSHSVGATCVGTVYQSVNAIPNALYEIAAGGVLAAVVVPLVSGALGRGDRDGADRTASALLTWAVAILLPLALVVVALARPIADLLLSDEGCADAVGLGADLLRLFAIQIPLYGIGIVLAGVLQSRGRFAAAAAAPLLSSILVIVTYLGYRSLVIDPAAAIPTIPTRAILVLGIGTTLGVAALSLPLLVPTRRAAVRLRPTFAFPGSVSRQVRRLALAGIAALAGQQLATVAIIGIANSRGGSGTLNVFTYVQAVTLLPYAVLAVPLATAAFPSLAGRSAAAELDPDRPGPSTLAGAGPPSGTDGRRTQRLPADPTRAGAGAGGDPERILRGAWLGTLAVGCYGAGLLVAVANPVGAFFQALDAGRGAGSGAAALGAIPETMALMAPGTIGLAVVGLLSRALYVRGRARLAGLVVGAGWMLTLAVPVFGLADGAGPVATLRAIGLGSSVGLLVAAAGLLVLAARAWGRAALLVAPRTMLAAVLGGSGAAVAGSWLGRAWSPAGLADSALAGVAAGLLATIAFLAVGTAVDRGLVRRLLRRDDHSRVGPPSPGLARGDVG